MQTQQHQQEKKKKHSKDIQSKIKSPLCINSTAMGLVYTP